MNMFDEAKSYYGKAAEYFEGKDSEESVKCFQVAVEGQTDCDSTHKQESMHTYEPVWKCFRSEAPELPQNSTSTNASGGFFHEHMNNCKLLAVVNDKARLKLTERDGWTMEATRNISTGNVELNSDVDVY